MELQQVYQQVELYHGNEQYVRETAEQIIKDFERYGIDIHFPINLHYAYDELYDQLIVEIARLLAENEGKLMAMLYTIDVSEKKIVEEARKQPDKGIAEIITEQTLDREFKKVLTRHYFKRQAENKELEK